MQVLFSCSTKGSPLTTPCPAPVTLGSGARQSLTRSITAADGGSAVVSVGPIDIDLEAPVVKVAGVRDGATYAASPRPRCKASDRVSGVARCSVTVKRTGPRAFKVVARAVDVAGHRTRVVETYRLA